MGAQTILGKRKDVAQSPAFYVHSKASLTASGYWQLQSAFGGFPKEIMIVIFSARHDAQYWDVARQTCKFWLACVHETVFNLLKSSRLDYAGYPFCLQQRFSLETFDFPRTCRSFMIAERALNLVIRVFHSLSYQELTGEQINQVKKGQPLFGFFKGHDFSLRFRNEMLVKTVDEEGNQVLKDRYPIVDVSRTLHSLPCRTPCLLHTLVLYVNDKLYCNHEQLLQRRAQTTKEEFAKSVDQVLLTISYSKEEFLNLKLTQTDHRNTNDGISWAIQHNMQGLFKCLLSRLRQIFKIEQGLAGRLSEILCRLSERGLIDHIDYLMFQFRDKVTPLAKRLALAECGTEQHILQQRRITSLEVIRKLAPLRSFEISRTDRIDALMKQAKAGTLEVFQLFYDKEFQTDPDLLKSLREANVSLNVDHETDPTIGLFLLKEQLPEIELSF